MLRHNAASTMVKNEVPIETIAAILGHATPDTTDIYITTDNRMRGFFVVYTLKIRTIHKVCVLIPTPKVEYLSAAYELRKIQHGSILPLWRPPKNMNFINNQQDIERLRNWCYGWNKII